MRPRPPCPMDDDDDDPPPSPRAKLLCSSGGTVLPRPLDHRLRYVGGETRILRVPRDASLPALLAAARALFPASRALKYLPPGEDFDALVSLVDDEDVAIMMEELDRSPSPSHLRLFADPPAPLPPPLDEREIERRYVDAVNSVADSASAACHFCEFSPSSSSPAPSSPDTVPERGGFPTDIGVVCEQCRVRRRGNSSSPRSRFCSPCRSGPYNLQASSPPHARNVVHEQPVPHARNAVHEQTVPHARNLFHEQTAPFSCAAHSAANSVYLGFDIGTGVYHCRGQLRAPVGPFARPGSNGLAYGMDGACPMPYGSGLVHPWGEQMRGGPGSGLACERASQVLQTNLAVSFTYNQPVQGASFGQSHFGREQQFHAPQMGFVNNLPLRSEGTGFFVPQQVCSPDSFNDGVSLETLRSLSLGSVDFQHGMNLGSSFQGPVRSLIPPALVVVDNPVWAPQTSTQPGDLINEAGFGSEACEHKEHGAAVELQRFGYLYQKKEEDGGMEPKGSVNVTEADSTCQIGIGKYSAPELTNAASLMALEGPVEVNSPSLVVSVSNVPEDVGKEMPAFSYFEIQGVPNDPEVCSNPEQAIAPNIEPTEAEAEAIEKGLQTIKSDDLEEVSALGTGAYGAVFHGKWKGCDVAIKRIKASCFAGKASERERLIAEFWKEALILSSLHHPNVVSFYGIVRDAPDGNLATVTEFMINGSLKKFLQKKDRTIDRRKRLIIAMDVAFGMEYLHEKNIVHFDLKCENLLVNMRDPHRPICKIGDLGLSKVKQRTFVSGGVRGTLPWMAPELLSGKTKSVSEKVDVYSFGIVMWELLTGEEPYPEMSYASVIGGIVNGTLRPQVPAWCDPEWRSLMISCWSAEPTERPSFSEISQQLRKIAQAMNLK